MTSVQLTNVTVSFPIYDLRSRSLKRRAMSAVTGGRVTSNPTGRIGADASHRVCIHALDRVNLTIEHGTRIGLVGRNGAGKSTLLHVIAGIYVPEAGKVAVEGKIASLFGSLGIDPELTGRENIELRGLFLGLTKADIRKQMESVIDFTELGPFIDMPFRTYSAACGRGSTSPYRRRSSPRSCSSTRASALAMQVSSRRRMSGSRSSPKRPASSSSPPIRKSCCVRPAPRRRSSKQDASSDRQRREVLAAYNASLAA